MVTEGPSANSRLCLASLCLFLVPTVCSCGGGTSQPAPPPSPPAGDFSLSVESATVTVQEAGAPQFETVQVIPINGFTGKVSFNLSGLPAGVTTLSPGTFSVSVGGPGPAITSFQLEATQSVPPATTSVTVTATNGSISRTGTFSLVVTAAAPFAIHASPSSLSMAPASTATVQVSVTSTASTLPQLNLNIQGPQNSSNVTNTFPETALTLTNPVTFSVTATELAQTLQNFPMLIIASDNANNTSAVILPLTVTLPFSANATPTRSTFFRTDQSPTGMVYDKARKLLFVSVEILNEVDVLSAVDGHKVASIPVNFPAGMDEAADGSAVYVVSPYFGGITVIDPNLLQVVGHASVPSSVSGIAQPMTFFQVAALSNGMVLLYPTFDLVDLTKPPFYLWDPQAGTFIQFGQASFATSVGLIQRSADHTKVLAYAGSTSGGIVYDVLTNTFSGPSPAIGASSAISPDGSQIASTTIQETSGTSVVAIFDANLNQLGSFPLNAFWVAGPLPQLVFSLDGKYLYIVPNQGATPGPVSAVVNTQTFSLAGLVPSFSFGASLPFSGQWITTFATDETGLLFGAAFRGVGVQDMNSPTSLLAPFPGSFLVQPSLASLSSPTQVQLSGVGFSQGAGLSLFVGSPPASPQALKATNISVTSDNILNATIPQGTAGGPANATLTRSDGFFVVAPDAITFGPTILQVDADAGSPAGGDTVKITGYGLSGSNTQVLIGGKAASITQVSGANSGEFFPTQSMTITTPSGASGMADVTVMTPSGSATLPAGYEYLNSVQIFPIAGALDAIIYDQSRQRLYVSNQDHNRVEVFDLTAKQFLSPVAVGNAPTSLALTPDGQWLAAANSADGTVSVIDPTKLSVTAAYPLLTSADLNVQGCGGVVTQISAAIPHRVLVSVNCASVLGGGNAHLIDLDTGSLSCIGVAGCASNGTDFLGVGDPVTAATPDGTKVFFTAGDVGILDLNANTVNTATALGFYGDAAVSADGNTFAADFGAYDAGLARISIMAFEPYANSGSQSFANVIGEKLNPSGSLLFYPQNSGVDIFDVHTGRLVRHLAVSDGIPLDTNGMALDESGTRIFLISNSGVTVAQLFAAPLSLGTVDPKAGSSATVVTLRGSGFENGASVTFATVQVATTFVDSNTLQATVPALAPGPVRITIKNPDGTQYTLDDTFTVN